MPSSAGIMITLTSGREKDEENTIVENVDTDLTLETLHQDAIEHVMTKLLPQDLCNFSEASKSINAKSSRPKFWQHIKVSKRMIKQEGLSKLFFIDKFKEVRRIDMSGMKITAGELIANLRAIAASSVVELDLEGVRVDNVPTVLLAKITSQLKKINLRHSHPTRDQCVALLQACVSPATMTHVSLERCHNLQGVPVGLLVKALGNLTQINLNYTYLTPQQYLGVVEMCTSSPSLVDLSMWGADLSDVQPHTLGQAVGRLTKIDLSSCDLSSDQWISVLNACVSSPSLVDVCLREADLTDVPPHTLGQAAGRLTKINLRYCEPTSDQCISVLNACVSSPSLVDVSFQWADLTDVPPLTLEQASARLTKIDLSSCDLTSDQSISVLNACISSLSLVDLSLGEADLEDVPSHTLGQAVGRLTEIDLSWCDLSFDQSISVLNSCSTSSTLKHMYISEDRDPQHCPHHQYNCSHVL